MGIFLVYGPFDIPRKDNGTIAKRLHGFWTDVEEQRRGASGLSRARGCYVFGTRWGSKITPWYVGKTNSKDGFRSECFQPTKRLIYNDVLNVAGRERFPTPILFLLAKRTSADRWATGEIHKHEIGHLEDFLIGMGLGVNKDLANKQKTTFLRNLKVPGIIKIDAGQPTIPAQEFKNALNLYGW